MKIFLKFMIFLVVLACAAPFVLKRPDGRPWMTFSDLKAHDMSIPAIGPLAGQVKKLSGVDPDKSAADLTTVYKWQDKDGIWHFSDEASTTLPSEEIVIDRDTNIVHFERQKTPEETPQTMSDEHPVINKGASPGTEANPYEILPDLIDQAKSVEKRLNQHQQQQEQIFRRLSN